VRAKKSYISKELVAFAYVQEEYNKTGDIINGLMPIFAPIIHNWSGKKFDSNKFAKKVQSKYDISMSPIVVKSLIPNLVQAGLLVEEEQSEFHAIYRCVPRPPINQSEETKNIKYILDDFSEYADEFLNQKGISISKSDLEDAFLQRVMDMRFLYDPAESQNSPSEKDHNEGDDCQKNLAIDILSAEYITRISDQRQDLFDLLERMLSGALIANVVLTLQQPTASTNMSELTVILDGPLIMDRLDLNTPEHTKYAEDLFELLDKAKVKLATFDHVVDEIYGSINAPLKAYLSNDEDAYGPLSVRFGEDPNYISYARAVLDGLDDFLANLGITVISAQEFQTEDYFCFCSEEIEDSIRNSIGPLHEKVVRRERDALSIATILRLRKGHCSKANVIESKFIFVTRNLSVVKRANSCLLSKHVIRSDDVAPCILDCQMAGVLWFCLGGTSKLLTREKLLSNCMEALYPRPNLLSSIRKFLNDIDPKKAQIFEALMKDKRAQRCLVHNTLGYASSVSEDNMDELLEEIKRSTAEKIEREATEREKALNEEHTRKLSALDNELSKARYDADRLQEEKANVLRKQEESEIAAIERACKLGRKAELKTKAVIILTYFGIVALGAYCSSNFKAEWWIYLLSGIIGISGFWIVPEKACKSLTEKAWRKRFSTEIQAYKIEDWKKRYNLDRHGCKVKKNG